MASPSGHQTMKPRTISAMVNGPHCGLMIAVFIVIVSQSRTPAMWPRRQRDQCGHSRFLALEMPDWPSHAAPVWHPAGRNPKMSLAGDLTDMLPGPSRPLRLGTLVGLRWLAVGGQLTG